MDDERWRITKEIGGKAFQAGADTREVASGLKQVYQGFSFFYILSTTFVFALLAYSFTENEAVGIFGALVGLIFGMITRKIVALLLVLAIPLVILFLLNQEEAPTPTETAYLSERTETTLPAGSRSRTGTDGF